MKLYVYYDDDEVMAYLKPHGNIEDRPCIEIETKENVKKTLKIAEKENHRIGDSIKWKSSWVKCDGIESELFAQIMEVIHENKNKKPDNKLPEPELVQHNGSLEKISPEQIEKLNHKFKGKITR